VKERKSGRQSSSQRRRRQKQLQSPPTNRKRPKKTTQALIKSRARNISIAIIPTHQNREAGLIKIKPASDQNNQFEHNYSKIILLFFPTE
jgi:hypothetical protein